MKNNIIRFAGAVVAVCLVCMASCGEKAAAGDPNKLKTLTIEPATSLTVVAGESITLTVKGDPSTASIAGVRWSSRNPEKATVENGEVKGVAAGVATIVATCGGVKGECEVTVTAAPVPLQRIDIVPTAISLTLGKMTALRAELTPTNADVTGKPLWKSLDPDIAEVDENGMVTAKSAGRTTITATTGNVSGSCSVEVWATESERSLTFFQFNLWEGLSNVSGGVASLIDHLVALRPNVASFCEFRSTDEARQVLARAAEELTRRTGTPYYYTLRAGSGTRGLLTRHTVLSADAVGSNEWFYRTVVDFYGRQIALYASHAYHSYYSCYLPRGYGDGEAPYGWNKIATGPVTDIAFILQREQMSGRYKIGEAMVADMAAQSSEGRLCIFGGDLNQPSHLDWTEATKNNYEHGGCVVPWPISTTCAANGILDAFRTVWPDPVSHPSVTWPVYNKDAAKKTQWADDADERDRIDFIYFKNDPAIEVVNAQLVGPSAMVSHSTKVEDTFADKDAELIEPVKGLWPSDHRGVFVTFKVKFGE